MTIETRSEFAKRHGWNRSHVTRLAQAGRLVLTAEGRVDVEASEERIRLTADPARTDVTERHQAAKQARSSPGQGVDVGNKPVDEPEASGDGEDVPSAGGGTYASSRAIKEHYAAQTARLEYERLAGALVDTSTVQSAARELGAQLRQALERVPDQLAPELAAESDQDRIHAVLQAALEEVLRGMADRCATLADRFQAGSI